MNQTNITELESYTDFVCTATNPNDPSVTYVGTWGYGVLKLKDNELVEVYNAENSTLDYWLADPSKINISGLGFDSKGNLWVANTSTNCLLSAMEPDGTWHAFNLGGTLSGIDIGVMVIDKNDYKWIITRGGELIVFNDGGTLDNTSDDRVVQLNKGAGTGGLIGTANCLAVDRDGKVWVGTTDGPCFFADPQRLFSQSGYDADVVWVKRNDGTQQKDQLFKGSSVLSMAVDGANQIWFGLESGVSLMSFELKPTEIVSFNTDNSPLFENSVTTIALSLIHI